MTTQATLAATEAPDGAKKLSGDALRKRGLALADECANLRGQLRALTERRQAARQRLAQSVIEFTRGVGPRVTDAQLRRDYIAASQREKADRAAGRTSPPVEIIPGPSYIDRAASWRGDADTFARKQHRRGGSSRGAYPAHMRGQKIG